MINRYIMSQLEQNPIMHKIHVNHGKILKMLTLLYSCSEYFKILIFYIIKTNESLLAKKCLQWMN